MIPTSYILIWSPFDVFESIYEQFNPHFSQILLLRNCFWDNRIYWNVYMNLKKKNYAASISLQLVAK